MSDSDEVDGNVHIIPIGGPEHFENDGCWCQPQLVYDNTEDGGVKCYQHKLIQ